MSGADEGRATRRRPSRSFPSSAEEAAPVPPMGFTGRYIAILGDREQAVRSLGRLAGITVAAAQAGDAAASRMRAAEAGSGDALVLERLGVALIAAAPGQLRVLEAGVPGIVAIEPERFVGLLARRGTRVAESAEEPDRLPGIMPIAPPMPPSPARVGAGGSADYLRGYRDAVADLTGRLLDDARGSPETVATPDERETSWGLQVTGAAVTRATGRGIKVAVLDTGVDLRHPDLASRIAEARSFVADEEVQDGHGHGTHCAGTVGAVASPRQLPRYGVAPEVLLHIGKVLSDAGQGTDFDILAGIDWAVGLGCAVVSMSLGSPVGAGRPFSEVFERAASRALAGGTLIVAAAGNDSARPGRIAPVAHPANCPSIMAVAALRPDLAVAPFSNAGLGGRGGAVDIAGPGVAVLSAWPGAELYRRLDGTSMATPHVAGIAGLWAGLDAEGRGSTLWQRVSGAARRLPLAAVDVGIGLVQAP